jgi:phospholipid/cholesterol/gamma-HCH transport system substrate-binding protein
MESADVLLGGYKIGQVDDIRFVGFNEFAVRLSVTSRIDLPLGTVAKMISSDILGTKAIELVPGTRPGSHSPGDTLAGEIEPDLISEIGVFLVPLASRAQNMMESMDSVLVIFRNLLDPGFQARFAGTMDDVGQTAASLRRVMHSADTLLTHDDSRFNRILANLESVSSALAAGNEDYMTIMENFATITDSLARSEFLSAINHLNEVLTSTSEIMTIIGEGDGSLGRLISDEELYNNLESAARNLDSLLLDLRERPGRYVRFSIFGGRRD